MVEFVFNLLIYIINTIIVLFSKVLSLIFSVLPNSPFTGLTAFVSRNSTITYYLSYLSWLVPIKEIIAILVVWLNAMMIYYVYSVVMRWIKLID